MVFERDTEMILRQLDSRVKCANPHCDEPARVRGEFCPNCRAAQRRAIAELRERRAS